MIRVLGIVLCLKFGNVVSTLAGVWDVGSVVELVIVYENHKVCYLVLYL